MSDGSAFQARGPAMENAPWPTMAYQKTSSLLLHWQHFGDN